MLLVEMKYDGAAYLLLHLLESADAATRLMAVRELGKLGNSGVTGHLLKQLRDSDPVTQNEVIRALGKLRATEAMPVLLDLLQDDDLYGPRSGIYHAVTEAFQAFAGITKEIENAFPGKYPPMLNLGAAPVSLPEAMSLLEHNQFQMLNDMLSRMEDRAAELAEDTNLPAEVVRKATEDALWKFGVMFADARDAKEERAKRLMELLGSGSNLERCAAALSLPWYIDERSFDPLKRATLDSDEMVRRASNWALSALRTALNYRRQLGL
jgi:HEAT repeat protein